jgi:hypothetical protein
MQSMIGPSDTGMALRDLVTDVGFSLRSKKQRNPNAESLALRHMYRLFDVELETILQELVNTAVELCGADSAGISLEEPETKTFRWIVVAGTFAPYAGGRTARDYSPCGTCLDSGRAQLYQVTQPYYDQLGVTARPILDGILIPWSSKLLRGTLWCVSHASKEEFCMEDYEVLARLAEFSSLILEHQQEEKLALEDARWKSAADMADKLAHGINDPLQSLTNTIFLAKQGSEGSHAHLVQAESDLKRLSEQVAMLLHRAKRAAPSATGT